MKNILIIDCGPSLSEVTNKFGTAPQWIIDSLEKQDCHFKWIKPYNGDIIPSISYDAWIITGSPNSVYEEEQWMLDIEEALRSIKLSSTSVLGICFGSQIIAKAFGGTVKLNKMGWELGSYPIELTPSGRASLLFSGLKDKIIVYESHQDHVFELPKSAVELARNNKGNQSFMIHQNIYGIQFHPEFSWEVIKMYVSIRSSLGVYIEDPSVPKSVEGKLILMNFINLIK
tara:strand:- start:225 stop:911 length:687 start_codon:yes stop_codon:yes gene_type:complete